MSLSAQAQQRSLLMPLESHFESLGMFLHGTDLLHVRQLLSVSVVAVVYDRECRILPDPGLDLLRLDDYEGQEGVAKDYDGHWEGQPDPTHLDELFDVPFTSGHREIGAVYKGQREACSYVRHQVREAGSIANGHHGFGTVIGRLFRKSWSFVLVENVRVSSRVPVPLELRGIAREDRRDSGYGTHRHEYRVIVAFEGTVKYNGIDPVGRKSNFSIGWFTRVGDCASVRQQPRLIEQGRPSRVSLTTIVQYWTIPVI